MTYSSAGFPIASNIWCYPVTHFRQGSFDVWQAETAAAHWANDTRGNLARHFVLVAESCARIPITLLSILVIVLREECLLGCRFIERRQGMRL